MVRSVHIRRLGQLVGSIAIALGLTTSAAASGAPMGPELRTPHATTLMPDPLSHDDFGKWSAITKGMVAIGAPETNLGPGLGGDGLVYVYRQGHTTPSVTIADPGGTPGDQFGESVAVMGSYVVVGAPGNPTETHRGWVYVFRCTVSASSSCTAVAKWEGPAGTNDHCGFSVAIGQIEGGDVGVATGCPGAVVSGHDYAGMVEWNTYKPSVTPWGVLALHQVHSSVPSASARFGYAVAESGSDLAIGSTGGRLSSSSPDDGTAYVFSIASSFSVPVEASNSPFSRPNTSGFGDSVAILGSTLAIGAWQTPVVASATKTYQGTAYIYDWSGPPSTELRRSLRNPVPAPSSLNNQFGNSVGIQPSGTVLVTVSSRAPVTTSGAIYLYHPTSPNDWPASPTATVLTPLIANDEVGCSNSTSAYVVSGYSDPAETIG